MKLIYSKHFKGFSFIFYIILIIFHKKNPGFYRGFKKYEKKISAACAVFRFFFIHCFYTGVNVPVFPAGNGIVCHC